MKHLFVSIVAAQFLVSCSSTQQPFEASTDVSDDDVATGDTLKPDTDIGSTETDDGEESVATEEGESSPSVPTDSDEICADWNVTLDNRPANVMLLEDVSASMVQDENLAVIPEGEPSKWLYAKNAISALVAAKGEEIHFGLDIFSNAPFEEDSCSVRDNVLVDVNTDNADAIVTALDGIYPKGKTPLYLAMARYRDPSHAPAFMSEKGRPYLVIISDGKDTCDPDGPEDGREDGASVFQLEDLTIALRDEVGLNTIVIGFGDGVDPGQLNAVAENGGTSFSSYLVAQDAAELESAFNDIAWAVIGCEYDLGEYDPQDINLDKVNFLFDQKKVEEDVDCKQNGIGWTWANREKTAVEFCSKACEMLKNHEVDDITAVIGCPDIAPVK